MDGKKENKTKHTTYDIPRFLRSHFPQLAEGALQEAIGSVGLLKSFGAGEVIMDYGDTIRLFPLVVKGSIKVMRENWDGNEIFLYFLDAGQTCSMSFTCCTMKKKSIIRTIAEDDTTLIGIPIKYIDDWMSSYQSWKKLIMLSYDQRMNELLNTVDSIAFKQMDARLLEYLQKKSAANQSKTFHVTHQSIATDLNASREAVSRLLKQLEKMKKVKLSRNQIELLF